MRAKRTQELRNKAALLVTSYYGSPVQALTGGLKWPVGSFRRIYKTLKKEYIQC